MKKFLLLGAAAMMACAVNAQSTIEKVWTVEASDSQVVTVRGATGYGDAVFTLDQSAGVVEEWKDGAKVATYEVNKFCAEKELGEMVKVKDESGEEVEKFQSYVIWTCAMTDDAGNIMVGVGTGAGSAVTCQNFVLLPVADRNAMQLLHIDAADFPSSDVAIGRMDIPRRIIGDIAGDGAYMYITPANSPVMAVMYVGLDDDGVVYCDPENSWGLLSGATFDSQTSAASFLTVEDILNATEEGEVAAKTYLRWRSSGTSTWDAESSSFVKNAAIQNGAASAGMDIFKIGDVEYMVVPAKSSNGNRGCSVEVYELTTNTSVAYFDAESLTDVYECSIIALPNADGVSANIYVSAKAQCFGLLKFTPGESAIESIAADNAAVEYYNLQGVKVANAENGLFIKKQGNKATKVVL